MFDDSQRVEYVKQDSLDDLAICVPFVCFAGI